jgi:hypothetical protein
MIRRRNDDGIDILVLEQLAVILVAFHLHRCLVGSFLPLSNHSHVRIADGHGLTPVSIAQGISKMPPALTSRTNHGDIDAVIRPNGPRPGARRDGQ